MKWEKLDNAVLLSSDVKNGQFVNIYALMGSRKTIKVVDGYNSNKKYKQIKMDLYKKVQ